MPKLHEVIALMDGKKSEAERTVTDIHKATQRADLFAGFTKTYEPLRDTDDKPVNEAKNPQQDAVKMVGKATKTWISLFDATLTLDAGNQVAKGDIVVDDATLAEGVPVPTLLALTKQLDHWITFIQNLPTPDPAYRWTYDANLGRLLSEPTKTARTKKTKQKIVLYDATKEHPAQTQLYDEDVVAGYWTTTHHSTAISADAKDEMLENAIKLRDAIKTARERANSIDIERKKIGEKLAEFVFGDYAKS